MGGGALGEAVVAEREEVRGCVEEEVGEAGDYGAWGGEGEGQGERWRGARRRVGDC